MPPFPVRFPLPPSTTRAAAAAVGALLATVALRRYLSTSRRRPSASVAMSALRSSTSASAATTLVAYGKSPQDQELLASAAGSLALGEGDSAWGFAVALAYEGAGERERARRELLAFVAEWKDADPDIPELKDARRRLS